METQGLTRSTLPMKETSRLASIAAIVAGQRWNLLSLSASYFHIKINKKTLSSYTGK